MKTDTAKRVRVCASKSYDVTIDSAILSRSGELIKEVVKPCKVAVITDDTVDKIYSKTVVDSLKKNGFDVVKFVFQHGESSKNLDTYGKILSFLAENKLTRTDALVALGGGVVGDMAGFAAATYLRGIKYIQIPTTLLSQIDSSVGGKTAIDLPEGKNLVGAFCQPNLVLIDVCTLDSLPNESYIDGMGEMAKYAVLDQNIFDVISGDKYQIKDLIYLAVDYKRRVVEKDEFEGGIRKLLNLGHTPAHGIEKLSEYTLSHGRAVAIGLDIILDNSYSHGYIDKTNLEKINAVVKKCVGENPCPFSIEDICDAAQNDKKRSGDTITLMMVYGVGDVREIKVKADELKGYLK